MSDYDLRPGGSLKLKGGVADGGIVKKKKKKTKRRDEPGELELELEQRKVEKAISGDGGRSASGSGSNSPAVVGSSGNGVSKKTEAEKRFEERQKQRMAERVAKLAGKTHKERVNEFNAKLEALSEHHDIPKASTYASVRPSHFFLTHY
ncbi:hypothetical protein D9756_005978 [Leucocoprinus leucothites]|uniref:DUF1754-domain-containing protein n=1 Tax=Leucocoprinus leucothites TaxID=201217 RepID=A0A8H5FXD9_9AGAR|nr:hypothetical protein D9756_005978 [Leucoagaricus leucothites]